ncbi:helix-turn-helix domain-containing protein [Pilimelia columellifera]
MSAETLPSLLTSLKTRSGLSYDVIARRVHISKSALHRYCQGEAAPPDFSAVERIARCCGASDDERRRLHDTWRRAAAGGLPGPEPTQVANVPTANAELRTAKADVSTARADLPVSKRTRSLTAWGNVARTGRGWAVTVLTLLAMIAATAAWWPNARATAGGVEPLLSGACAEPVALGRTDGCVSELQRLLLKAGAEIEIDGSFGPITQSKVSAYQALANLPVTGQADDATKKALYAGTVPLRSWPRDQVEARIRQVFVEAPDLAVRVAECRSHLEALSAAANADGTHSWGVFQLTDQMIKQLEGTRLLALDPEWNIRAAHRRYLAHADFGERFCDRAVAPGPTARRSVGLDTQRAASAPGGA